MKWIHKHVFQLLTVNKELNFAALKPEGVDSNLFTYHLGQLVRDGYIEKREKLYTLTKEGKRFVAGFSLKDGRSTRVPRTFVGLYAQNTKGLVALYKWSRQPYLGHVGLPMSRLRYGESVHDAVSNNIKHKTGLQGELDHLGDAYVIVKEGEEIATHYLIHLFGLRNPKGEIRSDGLTGTPFWGAVEDYRSEELVYGTKELIDICRAGKPFFTEINIAKKN